MRKSRVFMLILSVVLVLALAACGTITVEIPYENVSGFFNNLNQGQAVPADSGATQAPDTTAASTPDTTAAPTDNTTAAPTDDTTAASTPDTTAAPDTTSAPVEPTSAKSGAPTTKEEIINLYVTGYNKIAADAKSITRTYDYTSQYNNILEINNNSTLEKLAQSLMGQFMKETTDPIPGDVNALPPVGVSTLSISPSQIAAATCEDKGDYYLVKLTSTGTDDNWEVDPQPGSGSAGVIGPLLRADDVTGAAGSLIKFDGLHSWVGAATVTAKIDKASGHITEFDFLTPSVLHFDQVTAAVVVKVSNCNIGLLFHQTWTVTY
jgi:hypothetical protein